MSEGARLSVALEVLALAGPSTGVGVACAALLAALAERADLQVSAYAASRTPSAIREHLPAGVSFRHTRVPTSVLHCLWRRLDFPPAERLAGHVSVVHGTNFVVPPARSAATVVTVNDATPWRYPELCTPASLAYPPLVRRAVDQGAFVHTASAFVAAEVSEILGLGPERMRVVGYGLPPSSPPPAAGSELPGAPYVLALSTVEPRKDYPTLVRAFAKIAASVPGLNLVIAGAPGSGSAALEAAIEATGSGSAVRRLGYVSDEARAALLAGASVLAYPSIYEGFGFPPLEAMAVGVPVVATAGGAVPEIAGDGAMIVPVGDADALAGALESVVTDPEVRATLVERGRQRVSRFSWDTSAEAFVQLYVDAAGARG